MLTESINEPRAERERLVGMACLLQTLLAALVVWQAATAVNAGLHARSLVTAPPFVEGAWRLLTGMGAEGSFGDRLTAFWSAHHLLLAHAALFVAITALAVRYLLIGRLVEFLFLDSAGRLHRGFAGYLWHVLLLVLHGLALYAMTPALGGGPSRVAAAFFCVALLSMAQGISTVTVSDYSDRIALRGVGPLCWVSAAAGLLAFLIVWLNEIQPALIPSEDSVTLLRVAGASVILCITDALIQHRAYCGRVEAGAEG